MAESTWLEHPRDGLIPIQKPSQDGERNMGGRLVTLETFIIDSFTRVGPDGVERDVGELQMGGGGTYAIIGSRIFLPPSKLGMIVDFTPDTLPNSMRQALEAYGTDMWFFRERTDGHGTTRAVNRYQGDLRIHDLMRKLKGRFEYLSPARYLLPTDILSAPLSWLDPPPSVVHMISDARRLASFELEMAKVRKELRGAWDPIICWEPEPYDHKPKNWDLFVRLAPLVDIMSPNHSEALSLLSLPIPPDTPSLLRTIESAAARILALGPRMGVVIRAGSHGAYFVPALAPAPRHDPSSSQGQAVPRGRWIPPFHPPDSTTVVDPTGAGNGFMGALAAALGQGRDLEQAVKWGSVAASFIIEQDGLPTLSTSTVDGRELWNGEDPWERLRTWVV